MKTDVDTALKDIADWWNRLTPGQRHDFVKKAGLRPEVAEHQEPELYAVTHWESQSPADKRAIRRAFEKYVKSDNPAKLPVCEEGTVEHEMTVWLLLHSIPSSHGSPGIIVDADVAARTPCTVYSVDGSELVFSKGIIGGLSEAQKEAYCPTKIYKRSPGVERRLAQWHEAVGVCKKEIEAVPKGERLSPWLSCMGRELPKRGIEI